MRDVDIDEDRLHALILDLLSLVIFAGFITLITWHAWGVVQQSWVSGSRSLSELETPVVIPQLLWFAGLVFFVMVALLLLTRSHTAFAPEPGTPEKAVSASSRCSRVAPRLGRFLEVGPAFPLIFVLG